MAVVTAIRRDPKDLIANVITEMICNDCCTPAIMDAVILSKMVIDNERKNSKKEG